MMNLSKLTTNKNILSEFYPLFFSFFFFILLLSAAMTWLCSSRLTLDSKAEFSFSKKS